MVSKELHNALVASLLWGEINSGSSIPIDKQEDRTEAFADEFCWGGQYPRYLGYGERILKIINFN